MRVASLGGGASLPRCDAAYFAAVSGVKAASGDAKWGALEAVCRAVDRGCFLGVGGIEDHADVSTPWFSSIRLWGEARQSRRRRCRRRRRWICFGRAAMRCRSRRPKQHGLCGPDVCEDVLQDPWRRYRIKKVEYFIFDVCCCLGEMVKRYCNRKPRRCACLYRLIGTGYHLARTHVTPRLVNALTEQPRL